MLTTRYINPLQHRVFSGETLVGYVTLHKSGWLFTAANKEMAREYPDSVQPVRDWQAAIPAAA
jgi:hypothetical protein